MVGSSCPLSSLDAKEAGSLRMGGSYLPALRFWPVSDLQQSEFLQAPYYSVWIVIDWCRFVCTSPVPHPAKPLSLLQNMPSESRSQCSELAKVRETFCWLLSPSRRQVAM